MADRAMIPSAFSYQSSGAERSEIPNIAHDVILNFLREIVKKFNVAQILSVLPRHTSHRSLSARALIRRS